jgi:hypothetical protein
MPAFAGMTRIFSSKLTYAHGSCCKMNKRIPVSYILSNFTGTFDQSWVLRIQTLLRKSNNKNLSKSLEKWVEFGLGDLGLSICTKAEMLSHIIRRYDVSWNKIQDVLNEQEKKLNKLADGGYGIDFIPNHLVMKLLIDFESIIFTAKSLLEYTAKYLISFQKNVLKNGIKPKEAYDLITSFFEGSNGEPFSDGTYFTDGTGFKYQVWTKLLKDLRDNHIHHHAAYLSIDYDPRSDDKFSPSFSWSAQDTQKSTPGKNLSDIMAGVSNLSKCLEKYLLEQVGEYEESNK